MQIIRYFYNWYKCMTSTQSNICLLNNNQTAPVIGKPVKRHLNAETAPAINRGSMTAKAWHNFWIGLLINFKNILFSNIHLFADPTHKPWQRAARRRRFVFTLLTLSITTTVTALFVVLHPGYDNPWLLYGQIALFAILSMWIIVGFITAVIGFYVMLFGDRHTMKATSVKNQTLDKNVKTAVIMPICNEDTTTVFAGLRAIAESIKQTGYAHAFDIFILSDSNKPEIIEAEREAWEDLRCLLAAQTKDHAPVEIYYRLRTRRTQRKSGNVADFCRRWGKNYQYMVVLDADSVMGGECLVTMAKLMQANPDTGIIQTATQAVGQVTLHARVQQFASRVVGHIFTLGTQFWQLGEAHYFGHNAIIRVEPFMKHCALAPIKGHGGLSGHILSHDFVEAALMRRAGYHVWMVSDLKDSYEQQPPDLLSELQRDRRWCQGNVQNFRLITQPGINPVHRAMLATGFMAYFSAPLWLLYLALGTYLWITLPSAQTQNIINMDIAYLWGATLSILFMPRILGVLAVLLKNEQRQYGGTLSLLWSSLLEALIALLQAPIRMVAHSLFVLIALTGIKLEWKSPPREAVAVPWRIAVSHFASLIALVSIALAFIIYCDPAALIWLSPVAIPLLLVVPITVWSSQSQLGERIRKQRLLLIPEEAFSPVVLRNTWRHIRHSLKKPRLAIVHAT